MDPLSFTASLIAVVGLAGEVAKTCKSYIDGITNHPREIRLIYIEVKSVKSILKNLTLLREDDYEDANIIAQLKGGDGPIQDCEKTIRELYKLVHLDSATATSGGSGTKRRRLMSKLPTLEQLAWPFRKDDAVSLLKRIATHKQTINAALTSSLHSEVRSIKANLDRAEQDRMHAWLVQVNPSSNHNAARRLYEENTGDWIFRSQEWNLWVNKQSEKRSLWIHGIPGAGKTILASHCIQQLIETQCSGNAVLVYYYCYHGHNRDETSSFLRWLISQLCRKTDTVSSLTYDIYRSGQDPDVTKLLLALQAQLDGLDTVYVAVDALDESQQPREMFLGVLRTLATDPRFRKIRLLTTSREYADIERVMAPVSFSVPTSHEEVERDIRVFVKKKISEDNNFKRWPSDLKLEVVDALAKGARGMFRWAVCQLDILRRLNCATDEDVRQTIKTLPKDLDETYMRILNLIHPDDLELVRFTIHWIIYTEDLIDYHDTLLGVSEVLSHYMMHRYGSSECNQISIHCNLERLKDCCGCLISFVDVELYEEFTVCSLSHYTIKEFLSSSRFNPPGQLVCLDPNTIKTYLPNTLMQMVVARNGLDSAGCEDTYGYLCFVRDILAAEEFLDPQLVSKFLLINSPKPLDEFLYRRDYALWLLHRVEWIGKQPSDEIIVLLRLLVIDARHLYRELLKSASRQLLCSPLSLTWYDFKVDGTKDKPKKMIFEGNFVEFMAELFFTSPSALLFLLENYYHVFEQYVDLNRILRSSQKCRQILEESLDIVDYQESRVYSKIVQKLHELGVVSMDEGTDADSEADEGTDADSEADEGTDADWEADDSSTAEPTLEAGTQCHGQPKRWLDVVLRDASEGKSGS